MSTSRRPLQRPIPTSRWILQAGWSNNSAGCPWPPPGSTRSKDGAPKVLACLTFGSFSFHSRMNVPEPTPRLCPPPADTGMHTQLCGMWQAEASGHGSIWSCCLDTLPLATSCVHACIRTHIAHAKPFGTPAAALASSCAPPAAEAEAAARRARRLRVAPSRCPGSGPHLWAGAAQRARRHRHRGSGTQATLSHGPVLRAAVRGSGRPAWQPGTGPSHPRGVADRRGGTSDGSTRSKDGAPKVLACLTFGSFSFHSRMNVPEPTPRLCPPPADTGMHAQLCSMWQARASGHGSIS